MKTRIMSVILAGVAFLFFHTAVYASYINPSDGYTNITTYDGYSSGTGWYGTQENNETEPGTATGQGWDLEGFFFNDSTNSLALVGGFDFVKGGSAISTPAYDWVQSGDIFLETTANDNDPTNDNAFYDYVLAMNFTDKTYTVYDISGGGSTNSTTYGGPAAMAGLPLNYTGGGTAVTNSMSFSYVSNLTDTQMGGDLGTGPHNAAFVDLSFLAPNTNFSSFFTMTCGNDVLTGAGTTSGGQVPEPATILLLGFGVAALGARARKKKLDSAKEL